VHLVSTVNPDDLLASKRQFGPAKPPKGWEPGIAWDGQTGSLTTAPLPEAPSPLVWAELVKDWGLDPETTEIVPGTVQVRGWDANVGAGQLERLRYYRATIRQKAAGVDRLDVDALCEQILKRPPIKVPSTLTIGRALVVDLSDWQLGKGEGGGSVVTSARIAAAIDSIPRRVKELRKLGRPIEAIYLLGLGDLVEQCFGHYPMQLATTDLDRRQQMKLARALIIRAIDTAAKLVARVVVAAVPGNHGENRQDGKAVTTWTDNDDLAVFEQVAEVCAANPDRYGHVSFVLAGEDGTDPLTLVLDIGGVPVGLTHSHQARSGGGHPAEKVQRWWQGQALGRQPIAGAQILNTGHYHHLLVVTSSGRTHFQAPAMDGGSYWWTAQTGQHSPAGMLTYVVDAADVLGWNDMAVL
jgi:hypothetical protein